MGHGEVIADCGFGNETMSEFVKIVETVVGAYG
jgi:hypothetical protein